VSLPELLVLSLAVVAVCMAALWLLSLALRNAGIVDIFWGLGFVLLAAVYFVAAEGFTGRKLLVLALVAVWGLRLSGYILWRSRGKGEDYRYAGWRERAGDRFWWTSLFQVFLLQGLLMWVISIPVLAAQSAGEPDRLTLMDLAGTAVWAIGFFFEAVGDWQLARFKADPANRGKVMWSGLWRYHPPPQLLRRRGSVVGAVRDRRRRLGRLLDAVQPRTHDRSPPARVRRRPAGAGAGGDEATVPGVH